MDALSTPEVVAFTLRDLDFWVLPSRSLHIMQSVIGRSSLGVPRSHSSRPQIVHKISLLCRSWAWLFRIKIGIHVNRAPLTLFGRIPNSVQSKIFKGCRQLQWCFASDACNVSSTLFINAYTGELLREMLQTRYKTSIEKIALIWFKQVNC